MSVHHKLLATAATAHRGVFDASIRPVLTINSGDSVEISTLSGDPADLPGSDSGFNVSDAHRDVLAQIPLGEGPHIMTGPIHVTGAKPGDELIVDIVAVDLAQDW